MGPTCDRLSRKHSTTSATTPAHTLLHGQALPEAAGVTSRLSSRVMPRDVSPAENDIPRLQYLQNQSTDSDMAPSESQCRDVTSAPSEQSTDVTRCIVLRVECLNKYLLKRFVFLQSMFRWIVVGVWAVFIYLGYDQSFFHQKEHTDLHLAVGLSALFLLLSTAALANFLIRIVKVSWSKQHWSQQRRRLAVIITTQLFSLELAVVMFLASSAVASKRHCNSAGNFCKWSQFLQWTAWNTLVVSQLLMTHCTCIWTDDESKLQRRLLIQAIPWFKPKQPPAALVLDAPWSVHLPKLVLWILIEATIVIQLAVALQGDNYVDHLEVRECLTPLELCRGQSNLNLAQLIVRCILLGCSAIWHVVLVYHSIRDMARTPHTSFRLGRILCRMDASQDLGLNASFMPKILLLIATLRTSCPSCQPSYIVLALLLTSTIFTGMASRLLQPQSQSTDGDMLMQAWLQRFAWTEPNKSKNLVRRNSIPKDSTLLRDEPMFCFETAVKMLYWSAFVYEHEENLKKNMATEDTAMQLYDLQQSELIRDPVTNTKALIAWSKDTILISFRGTANKQNALHDIQAWLVPHASEVADTVQCGFGSAAAVHSGFSISWQNNLKQSVCALLKTVVNDDIEVARKLRVLITGHSLGGAMAVLAAYDIVDLYPWRHVQVYTVGAPRPGNQAFADKYDAKVPDTWHVINPADPVPKVGKFGALYARPGQRVLLDLLGDMQVRPTPLEMRLPTLNPFMQVVTSFPVVSIIFTRCAFMRSVKAHLLASYRNCLLNIVKRELKRPRFEDGLEGILLLINSVNLTDMLAAADEDIALANDLSRHDVEKTEEPDQIGHVEDANHQPPTDAAANV